MSVAYDLFIGEFLSKITDRDLLSMYPEERDETVLGYMRRAINGFKNVCKYDLVSTRNDENRTFEVDIPSEDIDEIIDIVSEGMVVQWLKPYVYRQELLENAINTKDFTTYSPAELLLRIGNAYAKSQKDFTQMVREYSFNTGDLTDLHL